ncbi:von Willebrand domain-containing protein [Coprinopsis cinerea okayama7|uniref:von Willebrand domain-containing protein n=1 Tax=Coprinopsis cinerea (strain Okayama-7 / 130 / ATCC MYA-4618 / FGSC 9003) TaxID=240176 RepID=A8N264_COPC7|nr:von Willebrand domain-containing protein [Coprinopsis cinerea okayama7\|eukprot:XP_001828977.1 von Willebrand domain-containing protein [Coprinopsis cinerea okayama7\
MNYSGIVFATGTDTLGALPLEEVKVRIQIIDATAKVTLIQKFFNASAVSTGRAKYCFPVPASAAICAFQMITSDGRTLRGECKEKEQAREDFEAALAGGRTAGLLDYVTDDIGSFPPRTVIETRVVYVMTVYTGDYTDHIEFHLPKHVGQRYGIPPSDLQDAVQPSLAETRISITADIQMYGKIQRIVSPSHPDGITESPYSTPQGRPSRRRTTVRYRSPHYLDHDFVLGIHADGLDKPRCFAEVRRNPERGVPDTLAFQLTMVPRTKLPPIRSQEYIFIVDCSGSMEGPRIQTAKDSLVMMLQMIPSHNSIFNIFAFGNECKSWVAHSQNYSGKTLEEAIRYTESMQADLGGTEMRNALRVALSSCSKGLPTVVFLLTDGGCFDVDGCKQEVKGFVDGCTAPKRIFTLGIGESASSDLCESIARVGNGESFMVIDTSSVVQKCAKLFTAGRTPFVRDVVIDWGQTRPPSTISHLPHSGTIAGTGPVSLPEVQQVPHTIHSIHSGTRFTIFALVTLTNISVPRMVTLKGVLDDETRSPFQFGVEVQRTSLVDTDESKIPLIHTMAAWKLIQQIGDNQVRQDDYHRAVITQLGIEYQLATQCTSFIAVVGIHDGQAGRKLALSFSDKHPGLLSEPVHIEFQDVEDEEPVPSSFMEGMFEGIASASSALGGLVRTMFTLVPPSDIPTADGAPNVPPGSWPFHFEDASVDDLEDTRPASPPSSESDDSDRSSVRTFSTISSLNGFSSESDWSSMYSDMTEEEEAPSPQFETLSLPEDPVSKPEHREEPPKPVPAPVFDLIKTRNVDGSFTMNRNLEGILGTVLVEGGKQLDRHERAVWTTICCVAYLKKQLYDNPEVLEGYLEKTMEFLRSKQNVDIDRLLEYAMSLL